MSKKLIISAAVVSALLVGAFTAGRVTGKRAVLAGLKPQVDTIYKTRTIHVPYPVEIEHTVYKDKVVQVPVYIETKDTVIRILELPREERQYKDSNYFAVVSGVDPKLDYLDITQKERTITQTVTQYQRLRPRWSLGVQAGCSIPMDGSPIKPIPTIGVGLQYNIISFGYSHR